MTKSTQQPPNSDSPSLEQLVHPWEPVYNPESRVLILGTFPSVRSRAEGFYYGHPQNIFWQTLADALGVARLALDASNAEKTAFLLDNKVAVWDVLHSCSIEGSSDASIQNPVPNTFAPLIADSNIDAIFTTGRTATTLFNELAAEEAGMRAVYLPSTSPANRAAQKSPLFTQLWGNVGRMLRDELVSAKSMKEADRYTIDVLGVPSLTLMERAAEAVVEELPMDGTSGLGKRDEYGEFQNLPKVLCVCGTGNNGGDGLAIARICAERGVTASAVIIGSEDKLSPDCKTQLGWARDVGVHVVFNDLSVIKKRKNEHIMIVDALFGIGLARSLTDRYRDAVVAMNTIAEQGANIVAVDIPSGISTDTGEVLGAAVSADVTVTFAYNKIGLTIEPGRSAAGSLSIADIGIRTSRECAE